ncbi:MAG: transcription termination/antitermination protein NusA [Candidatus Magasanikbacteria bacterium]|jgi:transcription termination/antitermination protein NusA|nr:transcription termination/antitermination protein NusA [Candidatus Magasanikbacteria bacterium]MBT4315116.1 transcription termination/antitermination protein NusA [Candidatus Magasanikbacteria bacterium]MBT4547428.1 transcription termination/antitermination protein NusA [Candidatus Magasanikbacteria bacterium]MBT6819331.1 transcription termination/antitermination protein NusA [Candidatus Magasanikbacteria bacterium]
MSEVTKAIQYICDEKGLEYEEVLEAVQSALGAAYRKDFGNRQQNIQVVFDPETGDMKVWDEKEVVGDVDEEKLEADQEELSRLREEAIKEGRELTDEETEGLVKFNPKTQLMLTEAKEHDKKAKVGQILKINLEVPGDFGRMAAQTAKQVVIQRLREAERNTVYDELKEKVGELINGVVQRRDRSGSIIIDLGKVTALLPANEQIRGEQYRPSSRMRFYIQAVEMGNRGLEIVLSRSSAKMVEAIFTEEIPEINAESVEIKGIARDAGYRSKVAVYTDEDTIDPIGSCIGQRGSRITTIIDELGGEKIDVIQYSDDPVTYIKNALSPAKIDAVELNEEEKEATVKVIEDQFSLAIGRGGQNVRLAAELTGWKINVVQKDGEAVVSSEDEENAESVSAEAAPDKATEEVKEEKPKKKATKKKAKKEDKEEEAVEEVKEEKEEKPKKKVAKKTTKKKAKKDDEKKEESPSAKATEDKEAEESKEEEK